MFCPCPITSTSFLTGSWSPPSSLSTHQELSEMQTQVPSLGSDPHPHDKASVHELIGSVFIFQTVLRLRERLPSPWLPQCHVHPGYTRGGRMAQQVKGICHATPRTRVPKVKVNGENSQKLSSDFHMANTHYNRHASAHGHAYTHKLFFT